LDPSDPESNIHRYRGEWGEGSVGDNRLERRLDVGGRELTGVRGDPEPRFGGAFPLPLAAGSRYPELAIALARGERPEPRLGEFREGVMMTRFLSHLCLTTAEDGTLEPFSEDIPEPIASEPGEA